MNTADLKQGTSSWMQARLGSCTGSRVGDALQRLRNGDAGASRRKYAVELICERLTGMWAEHFVTGAMEWGTTTEPLARAAYEYRTGSDVDLVGFVQHPTIAKFGSSPDGLIGSDGILELKCPTTATHVAWMIAGGVPEEHILQLDAAMSCTGRKWADFVSFDPRLPARYQLFIVRRPRDEGVIEMVEAAVQKFLAEVDELMAKMAALNPPLPDESSDPDDWDAGTYIQPEDIPDFSDQYTLREQFSASLAKED